VSGPFKPEEDLFELGVEMIRSHSEGARRIIARWGEFDAVVRQAQSAMRNSGDSELAVLADEIDRVRWAIGGQP
jgi:hypothetical protein